MRDFGPLPLPHFYWFATLAVLVVRYRVLPKEVGGGGLGEGPRVVYEDDCCGLFFNLFRELVNDDYDLWTLGMC
jgi:hypothetical protein